MKKIFQSLAIALTAALLVCNVSCSTTGAKGGSDKIVCAYKVGNVEKVRFATTDVYRNWVEMAAKKDTPGQESMRTITQEVTMTREVTAVDEAGIATVKVTLDEVKIYFAKTLQDKTTEKNYLSNAEGTKSDWPDAVKLAGLSYQIKVAPDTTVLEIIGLEDLRKTASLESDDKGAIASVLSEDFIRQCHQREFVQKGVTVGKPVDGIYPVPNVMIKAQAIKKNYVASKDESGKVAVLISGEALHELPEGMAKPKEPQDWGRSLIKDKSDMNKLDIAGMATFDAVTGQVLDELSSVSAELVLLEENVFPDKAPKDKAQEATAGNMMFTTVENTSQFDVVK